MELSVGMKLLALGGLLRVCCLVLVGKSGILEGDLFFLASKWTSFDAVNEEAFKQKWDVNVVENSPLIAKILSNFFQGTNEQAVSLFFVVVDLLHAFILLQITKIFVCDNIKVHRKELEVMELVKYDPKNKHNRNGLNLKDYRNSHYPKDIKCTGFVSYEKLPVLVLCSYIFNPVVVVSVLVKNTSILTFTATSLSILLYMKKDYSLLGSMVAAIVVNLDFMLIIPLLPFIIDFSSVGKSTTNLLLFGTQYLAIILGFSQMLNTNYTNLWEQQLSQFFSDDHKPNLSVFWYFFSEVFVEYAGFFKATFLIHPFIYIFPLCSLLWKANHKIPLHPLIVSEILLWTVVVFHPFIDLYGISYGFCLCFHQLENLWRLKRPIVYFYVIMIALALLPVMIQLWIYRSAGNGNFVYFQTLLFLYVSAGFVIKMIEALVSRRKIIETYFELQTKSGTILLSGKQAH